MTYTIYSKQDKKNYIKKDYCKKLNKLQALTNTN